MRALKEHSTPILEGIRSKIGDDLHLQRAGLVQQVIEAVKAHGGSEIGFLGHNIKLGRGGIREIEFFAQTQQLIFAGRDPYLRCQRTVDALSEFDNEKIAPCHCTEFRGQVTLWKAFGERFVLNTAGNRFSFGE